MRLKSCFRNKRQMAESFKAGKGRLKRWEAQDLDLEADMCIRYGETQNAICMAF